VYALKVPQKTNPSVGAARQDFKNCFRISHTRYFLECRVKAANMEYPFLN